MKSFIVVGADVITPKNSEPFVGLTVNLNGKQERIARTCKQALLDLHKSARGSQLPETLFNNGFAQANVGLRRIFNNEVIALIGKAGIGDISTYKAGDTYVATVESIKVKAGEAEVGQQLVAEKDGTRVEGFLSFPLTDGELMRRDLIGAMASELAMSFGASLGLGAVAHVVEQPKAETTGFEDFETPVVETPEAVHAGEEAIGSNAPKTGKK